MAAISRAGIVPAALEIVDRTCLRAVDDWMHLGLPADVDTLLLARVDERGAAGDEIADHVADVFAEAGGTDVERATDPGTSTGCSRPADSPTRHSNGSARC